VAGMALIKVGVAVINLFSATAGRKSG